jgi:hypothetical protein
MRSPGISPNSRASRAAGKPREDHHDVPRLSPPWRTATGVGAGLTDAAPGTQGWHRGVVGAGRSVAITDSHTHSPKGRAPGDVPRPRAGRRARCLYGPMVYARCSFGAAPAGPTNMPKWASYSGPRACTPAAALAQSSVTLDSTTSRTNPRYHARGYALHWLRPGRAWAVDFAEPAPADGDAPSAGGGLVAVRDLASGYQLAWQPVSQLTAAAAVPVLAGLFGRHGAPWSSGATMAPPSAPRRRRPSSSRRVSGSCTRRRPAPRTMGLSRPASALGKRGPSSTPKTGGGSTTGRPTTWPRPGRRPTTHAGPARPQPGRRLAGALFDHRSRTRVLRPGRPAAALRGASATRHPARWGAGSLAPECPGPPGTPPCPRGARRSLIHEEVNSPKARPSRCAAGGAGSFISPLCEKSFTLDALSANNPALTLAHVLPEALGGVVSDTWPTVLAARQPVCEVARVAAGVLANRLRPG